MREMLQQGATAFVLLLATVVCGARTFTVLDTVTGQPIADVDADLVAHAQMPFSLGHPWIAQVGDWHLKSDQNGQFSILSPWADRAEVTALKKKGYVFIPTAKAYQWIRENSRHLARIEDMRPQEIYYLTADADEVAEFARALVERSAEDIFLSGTNIDMLRMALERLAASYSRAKLRAGSDKEMSALAEFCQFAPTMKREIAGMQLDASQGGHPVSDLRRNLKAGAQALIHDCEGQR